MQEIITYLIIGSAVTLAILKILNKFGGKKKKQKADIKKDTFLMQHDCSNCSADCMLRNAASPLTQNNQDLCEKIEMKSNDL